MRNIMLSVHVGSLLSTTGRRASWLPRLAIANTLVAVCKADKTSLKCWYGIGRCDRDLPASYYLLIASPNVKQLKQVNFFQISSDCAK